MEPVPKLFGSATRTKVLVAIALLKETYPSELARTLNLPIVTVQRIVNDLDREGVVASRLLGSARIVKLNDRMYGAEDFEKFLTKYARRTNIQDSLSKLRRRPRRAGKAL